MNDIDVRLANILATRDQAKDQGKLFLEMASLVAEDAATALGRELDEIGILIAGGNDKYLRFVAPRQLSSLGTIPTTKRDSIAVNVRKVADYFDSKALFLRAGRPERF